MARLRRPRWRTVGLVLLIVLGVALAAGAWYVQPQPLLPEAAASLASTPEVTFREVDGRFEWAPADGDYGTGLVIYPGGKVPPAAYGPLARAIAAQGYLVAIVPVPFNLAVLDINAAQTVLDAHPEVEAWAVGGHSLGGSMAAQYAASHPEQVDGLALWASYAATDLASLPLEVASVYGTLDPGAPRMSGAEARAVLPADAAFIPVEGGNHEQMGWYTGQPNDAPATITRDEQERRVAEATVGLLRGLAPD